MRGIPIKNLIIAALLLLGFGAARLPIERGVAEELRERRFVDDNVDLSMMEKLGQDGFAAALGGFRPLVASFYYLKAFNDAMDKEEWGRVDQTYGLITTLQPNNGHYWDNYIWHLGWNAYAWANGEAEYQERLGNDWKAANLRDFTAPGYLDRAAEVGEKAISIVDDDFRLYQRLGYFYEDKMDDNCLGAHWYQRGSQLPDAPRYMHNIYAILLADCEGSEDEAYAAISERYWNPGPRGIVLSVAIKMEELEDKLSIRLLEEKGLEEVRNLAESETEGYLNRAALAYHYAKIAPDPKRAMAIYSDILGSGGEKVPSYYKQKWALLAAGFPDREKVAYKTLREEMSKTRRRLKPEEKEIVRPLEERLGIPQDKRLFPSKKKE